MPVFNCVGYSSVTPDKESSLEAFLRYHVTLTRSVIRNNAHWYRPPVYYYVDTNAGNGKPNQMCDGSPLVFMKVIRTFDVQYQAHFIDKEKTNTDSLIEMLNGANDSTVHCCNNQIALPSILGQFPARAYGLVYSDPNAMDDDHWNLVHMAKSFRPKMDLLMRVSASSLKRNNKRLTNYIGRMNKSTWIVQEPLRWDKWQWTFLFCSNFPSFKGVDRRRFFRTDTERGRYILDKLDSTSHERQERNQPALFF